MEHFLVNSMQEDPSLTCSAKPYQVTQQTIKEDEIKQEKDIWVTGYDLFITLMRDDLKGDKEKILQMKKLLSDPLLWNPLASRKENKKLV